jgi:predicted dithiol-disulfide oxidoreductase (DUF899 family)
MMKYYHGNRFPGENDTYRKARYGLLEKEIELRKNLEEVAKLRRSLPFGGKIKKDYIFEEGAFDLSDMHTVKDIRFSELFSKGKDSLIIYSFMYPSDSSTPCPMCTSVLDGLNGIIPHARERVNLVVVAKASIQKIRSWASERGWTNLRLLSSGKNSYNADYFAENAEWGQMPAINVFQKTKNGIYHFYNAELLYTPMENGQETRHADLIWPLWNLFDLTPYGRGADWHPKLSYK